MQGELTNPDHGPEGSDVRTAEAWKFISIVRDGMMLAMGAILVWSVSTLYTLSLAVTEIRASKYDATAAVALEHRVNERVEANRKSTEEIAKELRQVLNQVANDAAEIKGRLAVLKMDIGDDEAAGGPRRR